jgi:SNF2 family DNA or RNA helicase
MTKEPGQSAGLDSGFLNRISQYLDIAVSLRALKEIARSEFLDRADFVSGATLRADLDRLSLPFGPSLDVAEFERALRAQLDSHVRPEIERRPADFDERLGIAKKALDHPGTLKDAQAAELAYQLSSRLPTHLDGHGIMRTGLTAYPHQLKTAIEVLNPMRGNVIVADEVGLGKTVTAGLVIADLLLARSTTSILILVPSNLRTQWEGELLRFFALGEAGEHRRYTTDDLAHRPQLLLAVDRAKKPDYAKILLRREWDWLILDEAHEVRNPDSDRARFIFSLNATRRLYLTATPVHNTAYDIYHVVNSLRPGFFGSARVFASDFLEEDGGVRDPATFQHALGNVMLRTRREDTILTFPARQIKPIRIKRRQERERQLYNDVLRLLRGIYRRHLGVAVPISPPDGHGRAVEQAVIVAMLVLKELSSHPRSALLTLGRSLRGRVLALARTTGDSSDLQQLDKILESYQDVTWPRGTHQKTDALLRLLPRVIKDHGKVVIYVHFRETKDALLELIGKLVDSGRIPGCAVLEYHGDMTQPRKTAAVNRFVGAACACLVSTDAGGTGLNLQAASAIVNFDFPWNPMIVEQRIGRIDRLGQVSKTVTIYNFISHGTIEMYVYAVLQEKLDVCSDILGNIESPIVAELMRRPEDFGIGEIVLGSADDNEMAERFNALIDDIEQGRKYHGWNVRKPTDWAR